MQDVMRGAELKALREAAGLTQPAVGAEFGISKQAVGDWEAGRSRPDVMKLRKLDRLYGAGGKVLALFDLVDDEVSRLRADLAHVRHQVAQLAQVVRVELGVELDEMDDEPSPTTQPDSDDSEGSQQQP